MTSKPCTLRVTEWDQRGNPAFMELFFKFLQVQEVHSRSHSKQGKLPTISVGNEQLLCFNTHKKQNFKLHMSIMPAL